MDKVTIQFYLDKAKKAKEAVKPIYNEVLKYTDLTYQITDSTTKELKPNYIDSLIPTSLNDLVSFLMSSVFSRTTKWASVEMNAKLYQLVNGYESDWVTNDNIQRLNKQLEDITDVTYTYLNQSNYYAEIGRSLKECVNIGVGAYRVTEKVDPIMPFIFQYVPLDDLYYWEDSLGRPYYVFKYVRNINTVGLKLMFGDEIKVPKDAKNPNEDMFSVIEVITPIEENQGNTSGLGVGDTLGNKFMYQVFTDDLGEELMSKELDYCPIVIFRWDKEGSNPNGLGLSMLGLKVFKDLEQAKKQREASAEKLLNPPLFIQGDKLLAQMLSLDAKAVNYTGTMTPMQSQLNGGVKVEPIQTVGNLLPLDKDIQEYKQAIRELYTSHPLGQIDEYKRRSAGESEIRLRALRQKWSRAFEFIERELLTPTFLIPMRILIHQKKIEFELGDLDITLINYKNALATNQEAQSVEKVMSYIQTSGAVIQMAQTAGLKVEKTLRYFQDNLGIPLEIRMTDEEMQQAQQQQVAQQQEMQAMAMQQQKNDLRGQEIANDQQKMAMQQQAQQQAMLETMQ